MTAPCVYICMCVCVCACAHVYAFVHMSACMCVHMCLCMYVCACVSVHAYMCVHVCICGGVYVYHLFQLLPRSLRPCRKIKQGTVSWSCTPILVLQLFCHLCVQPHSQPGTPTTLRGADGASLETCKSCVSSYRAPPVRIAS